MIVNLLVKYETSDPFGCVVPNDESESLCIVKIFKFLYMFNIPKVSVPIPILLPTETESGILDTNISVVNPADGDPLIVDIVVVVEVVTPILKELFKDDISVERPDILTISLFFKL